MLLTIENPARENPHETMENNTITFINELTVLKILKVKCGQTTSQVVPESQKGKQTVGNNDC